MDFDKICRCCLADDMDLTSIMNSIEVDGQVETLAKCLSTCLDVEMLPEDGFPQSICEDCLNQIHSILSFKNTVIDSKRKILEQMGGASQSPITSRQSLTNMDKFSEEDTRDDSRSEFSFSDFNVNQKSQTIENSEIDSECEEKQKNQRKNKSEQIPQMYYCTLCECNFSKSKDLSMHCLNKHKQDKTTGRICSYCTERFDDAKSLDRHKMRHLTPFLCDGCLESFRNLSELHGHTETCLLYKAHLDNSIPESKVQKRVVCAFCGKSYVASYIRLHMLLHSDECKYKCNHCSKAFKTACSLKSHIIFNHKDEKKHKCQFCDLEFKTSCLKSAHIKNKHFKEKNISCPTCDKKFFSASMVKMHMLTHSGEKKHVCHVCDKAYQKRYGLLVHLKSHHV